MEQSPSEANSRSTSHEIPGFYETRIFITVFTKVRHCYYHFLQRQNTLVISTCGSSSSLLLFWKQTSNPLPRECAVDHCA
jgi:hypothetical protein